MLFAVLSQVLHRTELWAYWRHDLDPFILRIYGDFGIRWYGMAYLVGILLAMATITRWSRQGRAPFLPGEVSEFIVTIAIAMIVGGRLGYCIFYAWDSFAANPLIVFDLLHGGMASHGGILGFAVGLYGYARWKRRNFLVLSDCIAATAPMGVIAGRIANFINGELWGRPASVPWAVIFPRGDEVPRHPSQLYAAMLEGVMVLVVGLAVHARHRRPGLTVGVVLALYAVARFIDEFWREPDHGYQLFLGWMSKGQLFSFPVLLLGLALMAWALRRPSQPAAYLPPTTKAAKKK